VLVSSQAQWSLTLSSVPNPEKMDGPVWESVLFGLVTTVSWPRLLFWSLSSHLGPCSSLL
jgi:hypothetical protein